MNNLEKDAVLRLFQQLHQDIDEDWYRASSKCICPTCGLYYRDHPIEQNFPNIDRRLCDGYTVHL